MGESHHGGRTRKTIMRAAIYFHLVAVLVCASFTLGNHVPFVSEAAHEAYCESCQFLFAPVLLGWVVCPVVYLVASTSRDVSAELQTTGFFVEALLCAAQGLALLPAIY